MQDGWHDVMSLFDKDLGGLRAEAAECVFLSHLIQKEIRLGEDCGEVIAFAHLNLLLRECENPEQLRLRLAICQAMIDGYSDAGNGRTSTIRLTSLWPGDHGIWLALEPIVFSLLRGVRPLRPS